MKRVVYFLFLLICQGSFAQLVEFNYNHSIYQDIEASLIPGIHTSLKPYFQNEVNRNKNLDSVFVPAGFFKLHYKNTSPKKIRIDFSPIVKLSSFFSGGNSFPGISYGGIGTFAYKDKVGFNILYQENRNTATPYLMAFANKTFTAPGDMHLRTDGDVLISNNLQGSVHYSPSKYFTFSGGYGKHFIGDGYRSLFLSDFAPSYPFAKVLATVGKFKYMAMYTAFADYAAVGKPKIANKFGAFHYLSWNVAKWLNIGFFESIIFEKRQGPGLAYDINYLNPVIFFRPVEYSVGSNDNALLGGSFKITPVKNHVFYFQLLLDEFLLKEVKDGRGWWANKQAFQLGYKAFDILGVKNLRFQTEFNYIRPFTYSHGDISQNYSHYNQPLAHALGANLKEVISIVNYRYKQYGVSLHAGITKTVKDSVANEGRNIFLSYTKRTRDYGFYVGETNPLGLPYVDFQLYYMPSIVGRLQLYSGVLVRKDNSYTGGMHNKYIYLGVRTAFGNLYNDY
jgi:hypothetical protein